MEQGQREELGDMCCRSAARHLPQIISGSAGWIWKKQSWVRHAINTFAGFAPEGNER